MPENKNISIQNSLLPSDCRFGSGPSLVRQSDLRELADVAESYMGTSHRQAPVKDMQVFQPNKETKLGLQADGIAGANKNLFGGNNTEPAEQTARFLVSGRLMNIKDGKMTVSGPGFQTTVPVDDKMTIRVKMNNPALARVGDKVELNAWYYTPRAQLMQAKATSLKITAAMKFGFIDPKEKADPKEDGDKDEK